MMKTMLIFEPFANGHHIEYLEHLFRNANSKDTHYFFCINEKLKNENSKISFKEKDNVHIIYLKNIEDSSYNPIARSIILCFMLLKVIRRIKADHVFLSAIIYYFPFWHLFRLFTNVTFSVLIYNVYVYNWKVLGFKSKLKEAINHYLLAHATNVKSIFILSDKSAAYYYNKLFHTTKFKYLPDPVKQFDLQDIPDIRHELNITLKTNVFLHFGSLTERKGTVEILKSLQDIDPDISNEFCLIIAGVVHRTIIDDFYTLYEGLKKDFNIIVYDKFCDYNFIASLCKSCDYILIPYKHTSQSSGVIGYGAQFGKTIIGPSENFIGKCIRKYRIGVAVSNLDASKISKLLINPPAKTISPNKVFLEAHTIERFCHLILN